MTTEVMEKIIIHKTDVPEYQENKREIAQPKAINSKWNATALVKIMGQFERLNGYPKYKELRYQRSEPSIFSGSG